MNRISLIAGGVLAAACLGSTSLHAQNALVNWENAHVHPLDMTPSGALLLAVNTPDNRLEVFDLATAELVQRAIPVGLDPVSVRARTNGEAWVVNHISDSVSIVDLAAGNVVRTLKTDDEPADVVFAGGRAFVSCSQANTVLVFDLAALDAAPVRIQVVGEDPRALAVSPDGSRVYVAIFESGNSTTILGGGISGAGILGQGLVFPPNVVNEATTPHGGVNPPPNNGPHFRPQQNAANPAPPRVGMIVKKNGAGAWMDDNGGDWTHLVSGQDAALSGRPVGWDLADNDVAIIDVASLSVTYVRHLMNICMALAVNPVNGELAVVGTDALNEVRFEPIVNGRFLRVNLARVNPIGPAAVATHDLNPHLSYMIPTVTQKERDKSLGDPRGIAWNAAGTKAYVTGMGSNNVVVTDAAGQRAGFAPTIAVGDGPTGIRVDDTRERLYVLNKFDASISVVSLTTELETQRVSFFDPTPPAITIGRKHLYDTRKNSGLGQIACASCHVDARHDQLSWDLGDPSGAMKSVIGQNLGANIPGLNIGFAPFHPMKGPMRTQTLQDIIGKEPLHWRGDRNGLEEFNDAFEKLQGDDTQLTAQEMQEFEDFLATIAFPPNPFRNFDNTLPRDLPLPGHFTTGRFAPAGQPLPNGDARAGLTLYRPPRLLDAGFVACSTCHTLPTGMGTDYRRIGGVYQPIAPGPNGERHHALISADGSTNISIKIPQLRNLYEKVGFNATQSVNTLGFGVLHDGSVDSLERFVAEPVFLVQSDQEIADLVAFLLAFSGSDLPQGSPTTLLEPPGTPSLDAHAAVGAQVTMASVGTLLRPALRRITAMIALADLGKIGVVAKGVQAGIQRGYTYVGGGLFQSDRASEVLSTFALCTLATPGSEITFTVVPKGSEMRIGIDRDSDGAFDRDEIDAGTNPAGP